MNRYAIYCTEEQTKKALELGAPIGFEHKNTVQGILEKHEYIILNEIEAYFIPTAEQMVGWLEDQGLLFQTTKIGTLVLKENNAVLKVCTGYRKEATLAAIDVALEYLMVKEIME